MYPAFLAVFWLAVAALAVRAAIELSRALVAMSQLSALALRPRPAEPPVLVIEDEQSRPVEPPVERPAPIAPASPGETNYLDTMSDEELDGLLKQS